MKKFLNIIKFFFTQIWIEISHRHGLVNEFFRKYWTHLVATSLLLVMFGAGFYCAWQIQGRKGNTRVKEQDKLIVYLMTEQLRYTKIFSDIVITMEKWAKRIERLERQLDGFYDEMEKIESWNEGSN